MKCVCVGGGRESSRERHYYSTMLIALEILITTDFDCSSENQLIRQRRSTAALVVNVDAVVCVR